MLESQNVLDDPQTTYALQQKVKVRFLQTQNQRLQLMVSQMAQNLSLLRHTNESLIKNGPQQINKKLNQQNAQLQKNYIRILQQNNSLIMQAFLQKQIVSEQAAEFQQHLKNYQDKILELRRSIQLKQGFVQTLENNNKYHYQPTQSNATSPHTLTMMYYQQLEDYKDTIQQLTSENTKLKNQNFKLKNQLQKAKNKNQVIQRLVKSQTSYYDFRQWILQTQNQVKQMKQMKEIENMQSNNNNNAFQKKNILRRKNSQSKLSRENKDVKFRPSCICQFYEKNQGQSITKINYVGKINVVASMLVKKKIENEKLIQKVKQLSLKLSNSEEVNKKLKQASAAYQKNRRQIFDQLNYYKKTTQQMLKILSKRKVINKNQDRSLQKTEVQQIIRKIKMPSEITYISQRKGLWQRFKEQVLKQQKGIQNVYPQLLPKRRPLSCIHDYIKFQDDQVDKYLVKQRNLMSSNNNRHELAVNNMVNFSMMLDQYIQNDQKDPFDFSVIKPNKERVSYAQMKKMKHGIKKQGLTLIQQDIF